MTDPVTHNWQSAQTGHATTLTLANYVVSAGNNLLLVVGTGAKEATSPTPTQGNIIPSTVKWGTTDLTLIKSAANTLEGGNASGASLWGLVAPTPGTHDIVITWLDDIGITVQMGVCYLTDVEQVLPTTLTNTMNSVADIANPTKWTLSIANVPAKSVVIDACSSSQTGGTHSKTEAAQTQKVNLLTVSGFHLQSELTMAADGTATTGWVASSSSGRRGMVIAAFKPAAAGGTDACTATSLADAAPVPGQPAVGQKHVATATSLADVAPVLGQPVAAIKRNLTATSLADRAPLVGQPAVGQKHALTATSLSAAPILGQPALGQKHVLTATALADAAPILGQPTEAPPSTTRVGACPQYVGVGTLFSGTSTGAQNVNIPASNAGDLLVLVALARASDSNGAVGSLTAGWTQAGGADNVYGGAQISRLGIGYLISAGTSGSTNVSVTFGGTTTVRFMARVYRFRAVDGFAATPLANISTASTGTGTTVSLASVTPSGNRQLAVQAYASSTSNTVANSTGETGGNWLEPYPTGTGSPTGQSQDTNGTLGIQISPQASGDAITGGSFTTGTANWVTIGFTLVPAQSVAATEGALPAYSSAGTLFSGTSTGAQDVNIPASNAGDLLFLVALARASNSDGAVGSLTAGWTQLGGAGNVYGGAQISRLAVGWLVSAGTDGTTNVSVTFGGTGTVRFLARVYKFTATNGFNATAVANLSAINNTTGASIYPVPVFPSGINQLAVQVYANSVATAVAASTGENGGDWTEPVAESTDTNGMIGIQVSDQSSGASVQDGVFSITSGNWVTLGVTLVPGVASAANDLTANSLADVAPTLGQPAVGQKHALAATSLADAAPTLGQPTSNRKVNYTANALADAAPTLGQPVLGLKRNLTATSLADAAPTLGQPAAVIKRNLTATSLGDAAPMLGQPAVGQKHALTATSLGSRAPLVGQPAVGQKHALTATSLADGAPILGQATAAQKHALAAAALAGAAPTLVHPSVGQKHVLAATALSDAAPILGQATVGQKHALAASALADRAPVLGQPTAVIKRNLTAASLGDAAPTLGQGVLGQKHALAASSLAASSCLLGQPTAAHIHVLAAVSLSGALILGQPSVGQKHALAAASLVDLPPLLGQPTTVESTEQFDTAGISAPAPVLGAPAVAQHHALAANGLSDSAPILGQATVGQKHALTATALADAVPVPGQPAVVVIRHLTAASLGDAAPALGQGVLGQKHAFAATSLASGTPTIGQPGAGVIRNLVANNLADTAVLGQPAVGQKHALAATSLADLPPLLGQPSSSQTVNQLEIADASAAAPVLGAPAAAQKHVLAATPLGAAAPGFGQPAITQRHALAAAALSDAAPLLGQSIAGQKHVLAATSLGGATPTLGQPSMAEAVNALGAASLASGTPTLGRPGAGVVSNLAAGDLIDQAVLSQPTVGQKHALAAASLADQRPLLGQPSSSETVDQLETADVAAAAPVLASPTASQRHTLAAASLSSTPALDQPALHQVHALAAAGLTDQTPLLGQPSTAAQVHLAAASLASAAPVLAFPTSAQGHHLAATGLASRAPTLNSSNIGFGYAFVTSGVSTVVVLGQPSLNRGYRLTGRASMVNVAPGSTAAISDQDRAAAMIEDIGPIAA